jgi:hypothetical protein
MTSLSMRRLGLNLVLLLVVLGLAGLVGWQLQEREQQVQNARLLPLTLADLNSIVLERQNEEGTSTLELKREGEQWSLVQPVLAEANPIKVRQLATVLDEKVEASYPRTDKDLTRYGLEPRQLMVSFNSRQLVFGNTNPVSNNRYILNGEQIQLVNETIYNLLTEDWVNFIALQLIPTTWRLTAVQLPVGFADSPQLVSAWQTAQAIRVEVLDPQAISPDLQKVVLKTATESKELLILNLKDELVLADQAKQVVYVLPISQAAQLFPAKTGLETAPN